MDIPFDFLMHEILTVPFDVVPFEPSSEYLSAYKGQISCHVRKLKKLKGVISQQCELLTQTFFCHVLYFLFKEVF